MAKASAKKPPPKKKSGKGKTAKPRKSVASASSKTAKKRRGPMNERLVKTYAAQLRAALGNADFEDVFASLRGDAEVKQPEAAAITSLLLEAPVAPSTARGTALARILKLHNSLATFKLKQRAVRGRSAA
jgi:hypothetical protein